MGFSVSNKDREALRREGGARGAYMAELGRHKILTHEEMASLVQRAQQGDASAREAVVRCNQRLVMSIARGVVKSNPNIFLDLVSEGNIGLLRAIEMFDGGREVHFSTYATWWIRQGVIKAIAADRTIRMPDDVRRDLRRIAALEEKLLALAAVSGGDQEPVTDERIAKELDLPLGRVTMLRHKASLSVRSIDAELGEEPHSMHDTIADESSGDDIRGFENTQLLDRILGQFSKDTRIPVKKREFMHQVVIRAHGIAEADHPQTFEEIAADLSVSAIRVSAAYNTAICWMKKWATSYMAPNDA